MRINYLEILLLSLTIFIFTFCSSSSKETKVEIKQRGDTSYVFDSVPPEDIIKIVRPKQNTVTTYIIQIGAFSSLENAKDFADYSRTKLNKDIKVEYKDDTKLYVVQVYPYYNDKKKAELFRRELLNYDEYKDAWIVTITEMGK